MQALKNSGLQLQRDTMVLALADALSLAKDNSSGQQLTALAIIDIRDFRELNRSFSAHCGDCILNQINQRLENLNTDTFLSYYLGNDEFGIVLPKLKSPGFAVICAEQLLALFKDVFEWENHTLKITINSGIAYNYDHHSDPFKLIYDAELALKQAKTDNQPYLMLGKNEQQSSDQLKWELLNGLHTAMQTDELELYYQPKLCIKQDGSCAMESRNAEALIRWPTAEHGLIAPDITIPLIEHLGSELELVKWLVNTSLKQLSENEEQHDCGVSINIPAKSVTSKMLYELIEQALEIWGVNPNRLTLEITEDVLITDKELAFDYLSKVRAMGVRVSIDDFGTGYSSLAYFKHIPADELKIDQFFVKNMVHSEGDRKIVKLIIDLAHTFNLVVVAEGVEDNHTLDLLKSMGCDYAQGFLISHPIPYQQYLKWLNQQPDY